MPGEKNRHNASRSRLYRIWQHMKTRCFNKNADRYSDYGGRGVSMCDEWKNDFVIFRDWSLANGYSDDLTIDRIDCDLGYSPDNCRWASPKQQARNRRNSLYANINGERKPFKEWCEIAGINYHTAWDRNNHRGFSVKQSLNIMEDRI